MVGNAASLALCMLTVAGASTEGSAAFRPPAVPLDMRKDYTKSDWLVWSAALSTLKGDFEKLIEPLQRRIARPSPTGMTRKPRSVSGSARGPSSEAYSSSFWTTTPCGRNGFSGRVRDEV